MPSSVPSCQHVQRAVDAFADGELSPEGTLAARAHLARCPSCRRHAHWQRVLHEDTRQAVHHGDQVAPGFAHRVRTALEHERLEEASEHVQRARCRPRWSWALVALVPLVVLALVTTHEPAAHPTLTVATPEPGPPITIDGVVDQMLGLHAA